MKCLHCEGKGKMSICMKRTEKLETSNGYQAWLERRDNGSVVLVTRQGEKGRITEELILKQNGIKYNNFYSNFSTDIS